MYTQGEWKVTGRYGNRHSEIAVPSQAIAYVWTHEPEKGADTRKNRRDTYKPNPEGVANAHLIAAAPRMAKLLERLVNNGWSTAIVVEAREILDTLT